VLIAVPSTPLTGNVLDNAVVPSSADTLSVTSFTIAGTTYSTGSPVTIPGFGMVTILPNGSFTFLPNPTYTGPVPDIIYTVTSSDGQSVQSTLSISVNPQLLDGSEEITTPVSTAVTVNLLSNTQAPPGTIVAIANFTIAGSPTVYTPSDMPVTVVNTSTNANIGSLIVLADGTAIFEPVSGYTGPVPLINYNVRSSDGQVNPSTLSITVTPGMPCGQVPLTQCIMRPRFAAP
jgi:hypothetical protein